MSSLYLLPPLLIATPHYRASSQNLVFCALSLKIYVYILYIYMGFHYSITWGLVNPQHMFNGMSLAFEHCFLVQTIFFTYVFPYCFHIYAEREGWSFMVFLSLPGYITSTKLKALAATIETIQLASFPCLFSSKNVDNPENQPGTGSYLWGRTEIPQKNSCNKTHPFFGGCNRWFLGFLGLFELKNLTPKVR